MRILKSLLLGMLLLGGTVWQASADEPQGAESIAQLPPIADSEEETKPLKVGEKVADVTLRTLDGKEHRMSALLRKGPAVVIFYRGGWCPYCNRQLSALKSIESDLRDMGLQLLALSPDRPANAEETRKKGELPYTLLSDAKLEAARAFGVAFRVDDATLEKYKGYGIDLAAASGESHNGLPIPSVFIVSSARQIEFSHANADYKVRLDNQTLLDAARESVTRE